MTNADFIRIADRASIAYAAAFSLSLIVTVFATPGLAFGEQGVIGGDFLAFYTAGTFALNGDAVTAYDLAAFDAATRERAQIEFVGQMWQYPPALFFIVALFALLPYKVGYLFWLGAGWIGLTFALRGIGFRGTPLRLLALSPFCVAILSHGQIAHATAALFFLAVYEPKKNWMLAGVAAGLLTLKPQLGLLIPFAFLAIGAWRTIAVAAATAIVLHGLSLIAFGPAAFDAFFAAVARLDADIAGAAAMTPPRGMTTLFGQLKLAGFSGEAARAGQYVFTAGLAALTFFVWRRPAPALAKAAFIGSAALLASPYAYGYEMTLLLLAGVWVANFAEKPTAPPALIVIALSALAAMRPFLPEPAGVNIAFVMAMSAFAMTLWTLFLPKEKVRGQGAPIAAGSA
ncbi:MAG: glycosyltransferase family 87 protein [Pseudomonadota bacterium]